MRLSRAVAHIPAAKQLLRPARRAAPVTASGHNKAAAQTAPAAVAMAPSDNRELEDYSARWEAQFWSRNGEGVLKPGEMFDAGRSPPVLTKLLSSGDLRVDGARVLIPGCGRGYDLIEFVKAGAAAVVGLELAPTAQQAASEYLTGQLSGDEAAKAQVFTGDFFRWTHPSHQTFDAGFDYTFLCALHPDMRADWAAAWARYLHSGGRLACICYPIDPERTTGPPWHVDPQLYKDLLRPHGFVCEQEQPVPPELSHPGRGGKECLLVFRRQ